MKIVLRKVYDSVRWSFIEEMLFALQFLGKFINWIMMCITIPSYSLLFNGDLCGFFKGGKGLRQGDPISPLLFVVCMEYLSRIISYVSKQPDFKFFKGCKSLNLSHLCFVDGLILFYEGDYYSIFTLLRGFETFFATSGVVENREKTEIYTSNMDPEIQGRILSVSGYKLGKLPFKYLGVPITARSLKKNDYELLLDKITSRI